MEFLFVLLAAFSGLLLGALVWGLYIKGKHQQELSVVQQDLNTANQQLLFEQQRHQEQLQTLEEAKGQLKDQLAVQFQQLSDQALEKNTAQLLELAKQQQQKHVQESDNKLSQRQSAIQEMLNPVKDLMQRLESASKQAGEKQAATQGQLAEQVRQLSQLQNRVQHETQQLVRALSRPETRGRWGEVTLKRVLEESGMLENCTFTEQTSMMNTSGNTLRPDVVLSLPQGRSVAIDSKTPLDAYISLIEDEQDENNLLRHVKHVKTHLKQLSSKEYWSSLKDSPEFVVMFIPVESAFALALKKDPAMLEEAWREKIVIATPSTLMATIMAVSWTWKEQAIQEDMENLKKLGQTLHERLNTFATYLEKTGRSLNTALTSYNQAVSSYDGRLLPAARRFSEMSGKELPELQEHDVVVKLPA